ncbi:MAG: ferritin-like domain-containing protein [Candidatus Falkowbacteria bacterium]
MKIFICEICGEAYLGTEAPSHCPFCGAHQNFLKLDSVASPLTSKAVELSELSQQNLQTALTLEKTATALYICMAHKSDKPGVTAMYHALAKIEHEHANAMARLLDEPKPVIDSAACADDDEANFKKTLALEDNAVQLYQRFAKEATEREVKIFFAGLWQIEADHAALITNLLQ